MTDFYNDFKSVLTQLYDMQVDNVPLVLRSVLAQVLRFGLLALCIVSAVLAVQLIISIVDKNSRGKYFKNAIFLGITMLITGGVSIYAFAPVSAAPSEAVTSSAFQDVTYTQESALELGDAEGETQSSAEPMSADMSAEPTTQDGDGENVDEGLGLEDEEESTAEENFVILSHSEISEEYTQQVVTLLENTQCTRTFMREIPKEEGQNLLLRLENGDKWQIRLTTTSAYAFVDEQVDFIYIINDYEQFHSELAQILQN